MATVAEARAYGEYNGWPDWQVQADLNARGGHMPNEQEHLGSGGGGGGGGFKPVSAADLKGIEDKVYQSLKPYYMQLVTEANGDFTRAKQALVEDYQKGVRIAKEDFTRKSGQEQADILSNFAKLGIQNQTEQEDKLAELNKRGMAVGQMSPDGSINALAPTKISSTGVTPTTPTDINASAADSSSTSIDNPANPNVGRGSVELSRLEEEQRLRQEAVARTGSRNLSQMGIDLKRYTNPDTTDRTQMGTAELTQARGVDTATRQRQLTGEALYSQMQQDVLSRSSELAGLGVKGNEADQGNYFNKTQQQDFVNNPVTT